MNKLIIISGPSGAGKGTVVKELLKIYEENNDKVYLSISATTRDIREGEIDGVSYYFIKEDEFLKKIQEGDFLEYNKYGTGKYYGTLKSKVLDNLKTGDVILEIDINGYKQVINNYKDALLSVDYNKKFMMKNCSFENNIAYLLKKILKSLKKNFLLEIIERAII